MTTRQIIAKERLKEDSKIEKIIEVVRGYEGEDGWGYNDVACESGNQYSIRQHPTPHDMWRVGDTFDPSKEIFDSE